MSIMRALLAKGARHGPGALTLRQGPPSRGQRKGQTASTFPRLCLSSRIDSNSAASSTSTPSDGDLERTTLNVPRLQPFRPRREMIYAARTLSVNVAGVSFEQRQDLVKMMRVGNAVLLEQEPLNRFDPKAVAVYTLSGEKLGYVPRTLTHLLRQQRYVLGVVESVGPVAMDEAQVDAPEEGETVESEKADDLWYLCVTVKPNLPALTIDLVPKTVWGTNMKAELPDEDWDAVRTQTYERAGYRCEVCGDQGDKWPVVCQEEYQYDSESLSRNRQTFKGFVALCPACHKVKHAGRSIVDGGLKLVSSQLMRVNRWTHSESQMYLQKALSVWNERSLVEWEQDFSALGELEGKVERKHQEWEGGP